MDLRRGELQLAGFDFGQVEDIVDQGQQVLAALLDGGQAAVTSGSKLPPLEDLGIAQDAVEGRAQLVAHIRQEAALGTIGRLGGFLGAAWRSAVRSATRCSSPALSCCRDSLAAIEARRAREKIVAPTIRNAVIDSQIYRTDDHEAQDILLGNIGKGKLIPRGGHLEQQRPQPGPWPDEQRGNDNWNHENQRNGGIRRQRRWMDPTQCDGDHTPECKQQRPIHCPAPVEPPDEYQERYPNRHITAVVVSPVITNTGTRRQLTVVSTVITAANPRLSTARTGSSARTSVSHCQARPRAVIRGAGQTRPGWRRGLNGEECEHLTTFLRPRLHNSGSGAAHARQ